MILPDFTLQDLMQAGVHFGHHPCRWNPRMLPFIFSKRNGIHIINLEKTGPLLKKALTILHNNAFSGGHVLFIGTKRQASLATANAALLSKQYFVNHRWLGGTLTNWNNLSNSIFRLKELEKLLVRRGDLEMTKKELLQLTRKRDKLNLSIGGIKDMASLPDLLFVIDAQKERTAIREANMIGIPIIAVVDSNSDPTGIDYVIPGNDDATRSIEFYYKVAVQSILEGLRNKESEVQRNGNNLSKTNEEIVAE